MAGSLGLFAGIKACHWNHPPSCQEACFSQLAGPRPMSHDLPAGWNSDSPSRHETGLVTLFEGQLHNAEALRQALGLSPGSSHAAIYGSCVARWGDDADDHLIGAYAAICRLPDGSLRLARSPWNGYSLFYARHQNSWVIASIPRAIFAAGLPKQLKPATLAETLYGIENPDGGYWWQGLHQVVHGTFVTCPANGGPPVIRRWYDPLSLPMVERADDDAYLAQANALLANSVGATLAPAHRPGLLLSGGLDSGIVADEMLRQLPADRRLPTFTAIPQGDAALDIAPGEFADERPAIEAFAKMHGRLDAHFCDNADRPFDALVDRYFLAGDTGRPALAISANLHGPALAAARHGCDWLFDAGLGNTSFSQDGRWAYLEFLKSGRWSQLWQLARDHPGDARPMLRRLSARSILPLLPAPLRWALRTAVNGPQNPLNEQTSLLRPAAREALGLDRLARSLGDLRQEEWFRSREEWLRFMWRQTDIGAETHHAAEQVYGIRLADATAYRPLIEFCAGLPIEQFVRDGEQRWLARRMALGRMPEAQRRNRDYGRHNSDWHARMTRDLPRLRSEFAAMSANPALNRLIDTDAALAMLDDWPDAPPSDRRAARRFHNGLTGAIVAAKFWRYSVGDNR